MTSSPSPLFAMTCSAFSATFAKVSKSEEMGPETAAGNVANSGLIVKALALLRTGVNFSMSLCADLILSNRALDSAFCFAASRLAKAFFSAGVACNEEFYYGANRTHDRRLPATSNTQACILKTSPCNSKGNATIKREMR